MPNKFLRLRRFRKNYVNQTDVVLTNHTSYILSLLDVRCVVQYVTFLSCSCLLPILVHLGNLFLLCTFVAQMLLTPWWVSRGKDVKQLSINISKLTVGFKLSISHRTNLSPNPHLVEEATCFPFLVPEYGP